MTYTPPEGFALDPQSGRYYRQDGIVNGQQWVTWFDADSGQYEQASYPAAPQPPAPVPKKRGRGVLAAVIVLAVLAAGVFGGHFFGLYALPFLTDSVNAVSVLRADGTVNIERDTDTLAAREGMRLQNRDTVRTGGDGSAWLSLDEVKAVGLSELTALRIDKGTRGFSLTLVAGEIRTQIDQPLAADEDFTVQAGNLALSVRGTVFTARYDDDILWVTVESGTVAVLDEQGNEIAVLGAGESSAYGEKAGVPFAYEYTPGAEAPMPQFEPSIEFSIDGIILGETDLSVAKSRYSGRSDYKSNTMSSSSGDEDVDGVYSLPWAEDDDWRFGYYFTKPISGDYITSMALQDASLPWPVLGKYRFGDDASTLLYDLTGFTDISSLADGENQLFDNGVKNLVVTTNSDIDYRIRYTEGDRRANITIRDEKIASVNLWIIGTP